MGAWVGAGPEGARGSGVGKARCQVAGEGPPNEGRLSRAVGTRPRGAGASTSFLPPQPHSLALGFSGDTQHSPAISGRPRPSSFPNPPLPPQPTFARSCVLALVPDLPSRAPAPRSPPPRGGGGPFHNSATRLPPLGSRFAPARCPLGACALRSAAAAAAPFFLKGNAEEPRVTVGEGDPEPRRPPREAADPPSRSRRALGGPVPPTPSRGGAKGGKWRLGAAEASSGAGGRGGEGGVRGGETRRARPGQGGPKRAPGMSSGAAGCELLPLRRRRRWRQQRRRRGHHGSTAGLSRGLHFSARRRDGARASEKPR